MMKLAWSFPVSAHERSPNPPRERYYEGAPESRSPAWAALTLTSIPARIINENTFPPGKGSFSYTFHRLIQSEEALD